jgi:hypothetical protein
MPWVVWLPNAVVGSPIRVRLKSVGKETGWRRLFSALLSASMPRSASSPRACEIQNWPRPEKPSVQSNESSPAPVARRYLHATEPPNHSKPSSRL